MEGILDVYDLLKFVESDHFAPPEPIQEDAELNQPEAPDLAPAADAAERSRGIHNLGDEDAKRCKLAFSLIQRAMDDSQFHLVRNVTRGDCYTAWKKIADRHARKTMSARRQLRQKFHSITMGNIPTTDVSVFIEEIRTVRNQLVAMGEVVEKSDMLTVFLEGLSEEYLPIVNVIDGIGNDTFEEACSKVVDFAHKLYNRYRDGKRAPITGLYAGTDQSHKRGREKSNRTAGHQSHKRGRDNSGRPFQGICFACGKKGHRKADCQSKHGSKRRNQPNEHGRGQNKRQRGKPDRRGSDGPDFTFYRHHTSPKL